MDEIQNSMKRILYDLLQDTEIQEVIKGIIKKDREQGWEYQQKIEALEKENKVLGHQLEEGQMECERLHKNCQKLEEENTVLKREKKEIQDSREEIFKQLQSKKKEFEPLEEINEIWQGILKLEKSQKSYLKNLCGSWDIKSFIALGKDKNGIKQLRNFIRDEIMNSNRKADNIRILARFFDLCIDVYNSTNIRKEHYKKIDVPIGKEYDSRQYIKTSESIINGVVKEVLLNGYFMQDDTMKPIVLVR
ncbi:MAG: hypothetical protein HFG39_14395 [Lachnospiraceae bacterium]|nr:hypothetical protein [Lachnospiraceae bacterium]